MTESVEQKKFPVSQKIKDAMALIKRGTDTLLIEQELEQKLARAEATASLFVSNSVSILPLPTSISDTLSFLTNCVSFRISDTPLSSS